MSNKYNMIDSGGSLITRKCLNISIDIISLVKQIF